jgi:hypothetical protein
MPNKTQLGVYVGNEPDHLDRFEAWIGQEAAPLGYLAGDTWEDIASPGWVLDMWKDADTVFWSVPLIPNDGTTLAQAATGQFNDYYRRAAQALADQHPMDDGKVLIRTGWEVGGGWFPWGADGDNEAFKEAFRQLVDTFRSVDDDFVFCFDFVGNYQDPRNFYPGKEWVDIISQDFYWNPQWTSSTAVKRSTSSATCPGASPSPSSGRRAKGCRPPTPSGARRPASTARSSSASRTSGSRATTSCRPPTGIIGRPSTANSPTTRAR